MEYAEFNSSLYMDIKIYSFIFKLHAECFILLKSLNNSTFFRFSVILLLLFFPITAK